MSATTVAAFPLGPLDPERSELLLRVVEGLEPSTLQWLAGFAAGVAHERAANRGGLTRRKFVWLGKTRKPSLVKSRLSCSRVAMIFLKFAR